MILQSAKGLSAMFFSLSGKDLGERLMAALVCAETGVVNNTIFSHNKDKTVELIGNFLSLVRIIIFLSAR